MRFLQWAQIIGEQQPPKTQWRRLIKEKEFLGHATWQAVEDGTMARLGWPSLEDVTAVLAYTHDWQTEYRMKWCVGKTYAVQRPDGKTVGRTPPIRAIRQERLGDISLEDVFAEGVAYQLPPSEEWLMIPDLDVARLLYAEAWERCGGNWPEDLDKLVFVLDWGER